MRNVSLWLWICIAAACAVLMWLLPGSETVPYHLAWAAFALCFGLEVWSRRATWVALVLFSVVTGVILLDRAASGVIDTQEAAEIPLMLALMALMAWHVRRRQQAVADVTVLADRERREARARELLTRRTSHEMRSPLTIARGYVEVLAGRLRGTEYAAELGVVDEELERLTRVCERLVRTMRAQQELEVDDVDLDDVLSRTVTGWAAVADRRWLVTAKAGRMRCSAERMRACLDTLVENAVRYTKAGDTIELYGRTGPGGSVSIGVADSGPGFAAEAPIPVGRGAAASMPLGSMQLEVIGDELSQTGLGLGLVEEIVARRGGTVRTGVSRWGGAEVELLWATRP